MQLHQFADSSLGPGPERGNLRPQSLQLHQVVAGCGAVAQQSQPVGGNLREALKQGAAASKDMAAVKRSKVETFVLVKSFLSRSRADATEENPFKTMAYHSIEVKMFSSVENKPVLANWISRQHKPDMSRTSEERR